MVIFVDFDDTLCLHKKECKVDGHIFDDVANASSYFYKDCLLNRPLVNHLVQKQQGGAKIILLSSASSKMLDIKKFWLHQHCPELVFDDYIAVSIDIGKTAVMCGYAKWYKLPINAIEFIDDLHIERWQAEQAGIKTFNPQLIMCAN